MAASYDGENTALIPELALTAQAGLFWEPLSDWPLTALPACSCTCLCQAQPF